MRRVFCRVTTIFAMDINSGLPQVLSDGSYTYVYGNARLGQESAAGMADYLTDHPYQKH